MLAAASKCRTDLALHPGLSRSSTRGIETAVKPEGIAWVKGMWQIYFTQPLYGGHYEEGCVCSSVVSFDGRSASFRLLKVGHRTG